MGPPLQVNDRYAIRKGGVTPPLHDKSRVLRKRDPPACCGQV